MTERMVHCSKHKKELPGLEAPPFRGEVGQQIFEKVSKTAWSEWKEMEIKVINEYRLVLGDAAQYQQLIDTMLSFLGLSEGKVPEVENAQRGGGNVK
jgi:Fe-S cluster biosynthesis and repair protein YggX